MAVASCSHLRRSSGVLPCDLSRTSDESSFHSVRLTVNICDNCGHVQLYCEEHELICNWLAGGKETTT
jgi:hypothetical protein